MRTDEQLLAEVNRSGFPLQIGIDYLVGKTNATFRWRTRYTEHRWQNVRAGTEGFIDLVLEDTYQVVNLVIETKRVQDTTWIFLRDGSKKDVQTAKAMLLKNAPPNRRFGWEDMRFLPSSPEAGFCVTFGEDRSRPMLERALLWNPLRP
jgi:hypothetical protein